MILVKLEGQKQVSELWESVIKPAIEESFSQKVPTGLLNYYFESFLNGSMYAWVGTPDEERNKFLCCLIGARVYDPVVNSFTLLVCFAKVFYRIEEKDWIKAKDVLVAFARANNCITVTGYIDKDSFLAALVKRLGASAHYTLLTIPTNNVSLPKLSLNGVLEDAIA